MGNELVVVKANSLIEASYRLTLDEMRLLALTVGTMNPKENKQVFEFSVTEFLNQFPDVNAERAYSQIKNAIDRISERWVKTEDDKHITKFRWVSSQTYFKNEGRFKISLTNEVMPYLTQLKGQFTQYQLNHISGFSSVHTIRIYELITQYRTVGSREITIEDLKKWLQVEENYSRWNNFKARVLDPAITEINDKSDLLIDVEQIKRGRSVYALNFTITPKKNTTKTGQKRRPFPHKNKFGKFVKLDKQNPKMSSHEYGEYARACLAQMEEDYKSFGFTINNILTEDLLHYWVFLTVSQSNKSIFGKRSDFVNELKNRGYKIVDCELMKLDN